MSSRVLAHRLGGTVAVALEGGGQTVEGRELRLDNGGGRGGGRWLMTRVIRNEVMHVCVGVGTGQGDSISILWALSLGQPSESTEAWCWLEHRVEICAALA